MKLSCLPVSFFPDILSGRMKLSDWCRTGRQYGLDGIDISIIFVRNHTPRYLSSLRNEIEEQNVQIVMVTTYPDFTNPDSVQRDRELEYLNRDIALSSFLGAKYVRIVAGQAHPDISISDGIEWVVENFKNAADVSEKYDILLLYENHSKPGAWLYPDFSYPSDIFLDIVDRVADTNIRINFDTANTLSYGEDPFPVLEKVMDRIETIHAADIEKKGEFKPVLLGNGVVPFQMIFHRLKKSGFDNWICIEEASNTGTIGLSKAASFIRKKWAEA